MARKNVRSNPLFDKAVDNVLDFVDAQHRKLFDAEPLHYDDSDEAFLARVAARGYIGGVSL